MNATKGVLERVYASHRYALGYEGILCDGDYAFLQCTCGWKENYAMPEDDIRHAESRGESHLIQHMVTALNASEATR